MFGVETILHHYTIKPYSAALTTMSMVFYGTEVVENKTSQEPGTRHAPTYSSLASNMLEAMNSSVDPCNNFFEYACGNWPNFNPVKPGSPRRTQFTNIVDTLLKRFQDILSSTATEQDSKHAKMAKEFYQNCVLTAKLNERGLEPLLKVVRENGGWPLLNPNGWNNKSFNLATVIVRTRGIFGKGKLHPYTSEGLLFAISSVPSKRGRDKYLVIRPPAFFLPLMYMHNKDGYLDKFEAYETFVFKVLLELKGTPSKSVYNETMLRAKIQEMISFEVKLASSVLDSNIFSLTDTQDIITLRQLQSYVKFRELKTLQEMVGKGKRMDPNQKFIFLQAEYFHNLRELLKATPAETVANYVQWRTVSALLSETTDRMREIHFEYMNDAFGHKEPPARNELCADIGGRTNGGQRYSHWGYALAEDYASKYLPTENMENFKGTVQIVRETLSSWFNAELKGNTKIMADQILNSIGNNVGIPQWIYNETELNEFYKDDSDSSIDHVRGRIKLNLGNENHFEDHLAFLSWQFDKEIHRFWAEVVRERWQDNPLSLVAGYDPVRSYIAFTAGFLTPPFYVVNAPLYYQLATSGFIIGHELTHGILMTYESGSNNIALSFWDPFPHVLEQVDCTVDHYRNLNTTPVVDYSKKSKFSEDYADVGGFNLAYTAYKSLSNQTSQQVLPGLENFNDDQLFFLSYAQNWCENLDIPLATNHFTKDIHSPGNNRVLGVLRNSKEFSEVWNCPRDSFMNPAGKCHLWKRVS